MNTGRRAFLATLAGGLAAPALLRAGTAAHVIVLGAGFGGATVARLLAGVPELRVTLIERDATIHTCPFSNGVLGGLWPMERIAFDLVALGRAGVRLIRAEATGIDPETRSISLADGTRLTGDVMVLAPGISFDWAAIEGLSPATAEQVPHAWKAGRQTEILREQLVAMEDGGLVVVGIPAPPFRCPPGPYERISLIAHYLKTNKPASKILVLDAQDAFSKQPLFEEAWASLYPGMIERVPGSASGAVMAVDAGTMRISTGFDDVTAAVANIIPPQRAARILTDAGLDDGLGWCPVEPVGFESRVAPGIHILGDAALQGDMPKSAFSANGQARACARAILARLAGHEPQGAKLLNVCYSLTAPDYGFSIADVYEPGPEKVSLVLSEGRTTALGASAETHAAEAEYARSWFDTITSQLYG
ncbi:NAD(P)/FAD-dependent oxidoreductase [Pseudogemmobacter humi]|uniref:Sulfide dehydrogenase [flavocytochrome c] flavoprotein chain n=1 Tax=Pseudogemmobacter humi TaxID=2483812 RepID=A0A3P5WY28_9RHOB|nr:NAD(P)/FAD-dependent oxidoreductase [Pseudogemmobacter humi]VDC19841.1 Sulfide dehydrogenase [flavocytochrome c] flavoprotein chain precursor [Pseudogemmobacter humi]